MTGLIGAGITVFLAVSLLLSFPLAIFMLLNPCSKVIVPVEDFDLQQSGT